MSEMPLSELHYAAVANDECRRGLYGPSVLRSGQDVPELRPLVEAGLLRFVRDGRAVDLGYWLTDAGRAALAAYENALPAVPSAASGGGAEK